MGFGDELRGGAALRWREGGGCEEEVKLPPAGSLTMIHLLTNSSFSHWKIFVQCAADCARGRGVDPAAAAARGPDGFEIMSNYRAAVN